MRGAGRAIGARLPRDRRELLLLLTRKPEHGSWIAPTDQNTHSLTQSRVQAATCKSAKLMTRHTTRAARRPARPRERHRIRYSHAAHVGRGAGSARHRAQTRRGVGRRMEIPVVRGCFPRARLGKCAHFLTNRTLVERYLFVHPSREGWRSSVSLPAARRWSPAVPGAPRAPQLWSSIRSLET